jgi:hypothetical protein
MSNSKSATSEQLLQLVAKFAQTLPIDADRREVQGAIENVNDPLWAFLKERFSKKITQVKSLLVDMIARGKYDWVNSGVTEGNFPVPEGFILGSEPKIFHFNCYLSSEAVIAEMNKDGYRPAMIWDLLDYGAKNPKEQRKYPIVALGSVAAVDDRRFVACLGRGVSSLELGLDDFGAGWDDGCRFLAVRI